MNGLIPAISLGAAIVAAGAVIALLIPSQRRDRIEERAAAQAA